MTYAVSIDLIKARLIERIDVLVPAMFPNARREGREWVMGDIMGAPGTSLSIRRTGAKAGWAKDFASGQGYDVIDLVAAGMCAGDVKAAIPWAVKYLGLGDMNPADRKKAEERARREAARAAQAHQADIAKLRRLAKGHFVQAVKLPGSPAERYLLGRGIDLRPLGRAPGALRFKPAMKCPESGQDRPCLVAAVNHGVTGELLTVHRTFLAVHADGRVTKAPMAKAKRAYCDYAGGMIPLWRGASRKPLKDAPAGEWLAVSEGIEDGLSVALCRPDLRVVAALSLSNMGGLALPEHIGGVYIAAQNDTHPDAIKGLENALSRLAERGIRAVVVRPPAAVKDWNDWAQALQAQGERRTG